jgi:sugar phosphate isomerase/epimerase
MDIGFVANGQPAELLERAARLGFEGIELCFGAGKACDLERWTADDTQRLRDLVASTGARILTVASYWDQHLSPDPATRQRAAANMRRAIELAPQLGTHVVTCMAFGDRTQRPEAQVKTFGQVFGEYARIAEDNGLTAEVFKNQQRNQFGTLIPFHGEVSNPQTDMLAVIGNALRNAFVRAYLPRYERINPDLNDLEFSPGSIVTDPNTTEDGS